MLHNIVPILYYSPAMVEQITTASHWKCGDSGTETKFSDMNVYVKSALDKMWVPADIDVQEEGRRTKKNADSAYEALSKAVDVVRQIQTSNRLRMSGQMGDVSEISNTFTLLEGDFVIKLITSPIDKTYLVDITHESDGVTIHGVTSLENWISKSMINQLLIMGKVTASGLIFPLAVNGSRIEAKFACIFIMRD